MHGNDTYETAEMLKRLQRQVSNLRGGDEDTQVTLLIGVDEDVTCGDGVTSASLSAASTWEWSTDEWSFQTW